MSGANAIQYLYRYPFSSHLESAGAGAHLHLATSNENNNFPYFFEGKLLSPYLTAKLLSALADVVAARYYTPANMLEHLIAQRDPVVTAGGGMLRFEGFSACCSAYARVDLSPDAYNGKLFAHGTTNVDFNPPMRAALGKVRDKDELLLNVGRDEIVFKRGAESIVERKVELPRRWLKGFVEVQSYQSEMQLCFDIAKTEAIRFLRTLPTGSAQRGRFSVTRLGNGLRLSQADTSESVPVSGLQRLKLLKELAVYADRLRIYMHPSRQASEWHMQCGPLSINLTMTAEVSRGFSGEGHALVDLSLAQDSQAQNATAKVRAALNWQPVINVVDIASNIDLTAQQVRKSLGVLGSRGLVGYDLSTSSYFHREMPFDISAVDGMHPRLRNAQRLVENGGVQVLRHTGEDAEVNVAGTEVQHRVILGANHARCTCPWHAKYQGQRGLCKHILAAKLAIGKAVLE